MVFDFDDRTIGSLNFVFQEAANRQIVSIVELRKKITNSSIPNLELIDSFMQSTRNSQADMTNYELLATISCINNSIESLDKRLSRIEQNIMTNARY